jgi:hypothetical protein
MKLSVLVALFLALSLQVTASPGYPFIDNMPNRSRLTDEEIQWYFDNSTTAELRNALDQDGDGYADGTGRPVAEFMARMRIILICRQERLEYYMELQRAWRRYRLLNDPGEPADA